MRSNLIGALIGLTLVAAGGTALASEDDVEYLPDDPPICPNTNTPRLVPRVDIELDNGRKIIFGNVEQVEYETWDTEGIVSRGAVRIPYHSIRIIDGMCVRPRP